MKKYNNIFLFVCVFGIIFLGMLTLVRTQKDISYAENRNLNKFEVLSISKFLDGTFQSNLENAYLDQFIGGETIKNIMKSELVLYKKFINYEGICKDVYLNIGKSYYTFDCSKHLFYKPIRVTEKTEEFYKNIGAKYSKLNDFVDTYYYYIPTSSNYNFITGEPAINIEETFKKYWKGDYKFSSLKIDGFEMFYNYFYKTDHHWNHIGSYEGYKDVMSILDKKAKILEPLEEVEFDFIFNGSMARSLAFYDYSDNFKVYKFDMPEHEVYVNGELGSYGNEEGYFNGQYKKNIRINHYAAFYGGDKAELVFDFNNPKKDNIMIIGNSMTNSVNKLIASHFNKTHVIDLRHYEKTFNERFNIYDYIKENDIDKVLVLFDVAFINSEDYDMWGDV